MSASAETISASPNSRLSSFLDYFVFRRQPGQLPELDGLRGIAVILVLLRHAVRPIWPVDTPIFSVFGWDIGIFMANGWVGVDLFFVLSGFLIAHHILRLNDRNDGGWQWRPYLERRALRIVPAYYFVLFLAIAGIFPYYEVATQGLGVRTIYHILFLQDYLPANIVVAFWSLGVEEKFYLFAPLLILARANASSFKERVGGIFVLMLFGIGLRIFSAYTKVGIDNYESFFYVFRSPFHMTLDPILIGVLLAFVYRAKDDFPRLTSVPVATIIFWCGTATFIGFSCVGVMMDTIDWWDKTLQPTVIALAFGGITFGLLFGGGPGRLFRAALLFFFARISYSLYLIHLPLVPLAQKLAGSSQASNENFWVFLLIYIPLSVVAALLLHFSVEKPFLLLKAKVR